ncbi:hypothetical protein SAMN04488120_107108 [Fontimonas thermophila]|uniref:Uncharacterized protein n=1 Tax=Fontimonas thermophila TaxID=1076937 RepID=A0A1I2JLM5_9GAMM|nr:hypothetical protein [Fontimonas thermophila]SFF53696.1 hypothetical protein SAMN04488120_107108 [Fontimonas thermophila]
MQAPDFAQLGYPPFDARDLKFLFEHFPVAGIDPDQAVQAVHERPTTLESLLESDYVFAALRDQTTLWLEVSPRLFFDVLLRRALPGRRQALERQTIHYLANLLALFTRTERLYRVQPDEERRFFYLVDLVQEAARADAERGFVVYSHIGNYALFLAGLCRDWIDERHRYKHRPVTLEYYCKMGQSYYFTASQHRMADRLGLREVFRELASRFHYYRDGLERMNTEFIRH